MDGATRVRWAAVGTGAGPVDVGPLLGHRYLAVAMQILRSPGWVRKVAGARSAGARGEPGRRAREEE